MKETTPILSHFGLVVKELRRKKQLSQEELANRCGLHRTYITDIEHGTRNVSLKNISRIAHAVEESLQDLFARVERYSQHSGSPAMHTFRPMMNNHAPIELLLIGEDQGFADQLVDELRRGRIGNTLHVVRSGDETVKYLFPVRTGEQHNSHQPTVILLDLQSPSMSGMEALERMRKEKNTKGIPVIALTASSTDVDPTRTESLGVDEYLTKPVSIDRLSAVLYKLGYQTLYIDRWERVPRE